MDILLINNQVSTNHTDIYLDYYQHNNNKTSPISSGEFGVYESNLNESVMLQKELMDKKKSLPQPEKQDHRIYFDNENIQDSDDGEVSVITNTSNFLKSQSRHNSN